MEKLNLADFEEEEIKVQKTVVVKKTPVVRKASAEKKVKVTPVVEDEEDIAEIISMILATRHYEVKTVLNPVEAIGLATEFAPDAILGSVLHNARSES